GTGRARVTTRVTTLGRSRDCDIVVPDANVSRVHAEVRHIGMDYYIVDMGSTNGTEVNGQVITRHALADGDVIVMGTTEIRVELR
ncbi:MAG: FHA domain-containing protein, partial [Thermoleophilia bacterium]